MKSTKAFKVFCSCDYNVYNKQGTRTVSFYVTSKTFVDRIIEKWSIMLPKNYKYYLSAIDKEKNGLSLLEIVPPNTIVRDGTATHHHFFTDLK